MPNRNSRELVTIRLFLREKIRFVKEKGRCTVLVSFADTARYKLLTAW